MGRLSLKVMGQLSRDESRQHYTVEGHERVAGALLEHLVAEGMIELANGAGR